MSSSGVLCFNPYFVGSESGSSRSRPVKCRNRGFQSLFCWKWVWKGFNTVGQYYRISVSILILLEVSLEAKMVTTLIVNEICFNPYFVGSESGRKEKDKRTIQYFMFQSLFCWKWVWKGIQRSPIIIPTQSFNPYFVGSESGSILFTALPTASELSFNPYFVGSESGSWNAGSTIVRRMACFNPYFVGSESGRKEVWQYFYGWILFQSLFCWKWVWKIIATEEITAFGWVSILILLEVSLEVLAWF